MKWILVVLAVSALSLGGADYTFAGDGAGGPACGTYREASGAEGKKFSVIMPRVPGMEASSYNDIGCAVRARNEECATRQGLFDGNARVYDYRTGEEIAIEKAFFVMANDVSTPAGYGIVAFKDQAQADSFAAGHGKARVIKWYLLVDEELK